MSQLGGGLQKGIYVASDDALNHFSAVAFVFVIFFLVCM